MMEEIKDVGKRLKDLREILEITPEELASYIGVDLEDYLAHENGTAGFSFTFLFKASQKLGVDITDLLTGESPKLSTYDLVRKGKGLPIHRRHGFDYQNLAYLFKGRILEPFLVTAKYDPALEGQPIELSRHDGQEFDYVLSGSLTVQIGDKIELLHAGDAIYYDASNGHGMIASGGKDCLFLAVVTNTQFEERKD